MTVLMLLSNAYEPDPRVRQEALSLIRMGCLVRILAWDRDGKFPASERREGVEVQRVFVSSTHGRGATQLFFYVWLYALMFWRAWRQRFDVVHCHDLDTLPLGFILAKLRRKPIVYDAHESFPDMLHGNIPPAVERGLVRLENFLIRRVDLLITVGEKLRRHLQERGAAHTVVIGNWKRLTDFDRSAAQNLAVRSALAIPPDALTVVCVTQLFIDRKLEELLAAVDATAGAYLIVAGQGALEPVVRAAAAANPRIRYAGFISGSTIADYTCAAAVVSLASIDNPNARFSAPNKLRCAIAGRPLITGDFGEIRRSGAKRRLRSRAPALQRQGDWRSPPQTARPRGARSHVGKSCRDRARLS
jgi:glycosyltransferase involved in cell wall biosynthesis